MSWVALIASPRIARVNFLLDEEKKSVISVQTGQSVMEQLRIKRKKTESMMMMGMGFESGGGCVLGRGEKSVSAS